MRLDIFLKLFYSSCTHEGGAVLAKAKNKVTKKVKKFPWVDSKWYEHPMSGLGVFGERLKPGDTIAPDDVYDSTNGKWEKAPYPGLVLQKGTTTIWVRPLHKNPTFVQFPLSG